MLERGFEFRHVGFWPNVIGHKRRKRGFLFSTARRLIEAEKKKKGM
jgi:hypothetical protein